MNMSGEEVKSPGLSYIKNNCRQIPYRRRNYLFLMMVMALSDFKIKYDNSILGYFWSFLRPLLMFGTLYIVFSVFVRWQVENYKLYLLLGIILWNFLAEVSLNSMVLLEAKASIVKKVYFPRWIIIIASSITSLLTLILNILVFFIFFVLSGTHFQSSVWLMAVYLLELYILVAGLALLLCALFPKFRDIHHIWEVFVQLGFWATPIIYPISIVPQKYHKLIFLNPVARIIQGCREATIGPKGEFSSLTNHIIIMSVSVCLFAVGLAMFKRMSRSFAEDL